MTTDEASTIIPEKTANMLPLRFGVISTPKPAIVKAAVLLGAVVFPAVLDREKAPDGGGLNILPMSHLIGCKSVSGGGSDDKHGIVFYGFTIRCIGATGI